MALAEFRVAFRNRWVAIAVAMMALAAIDRATVLAPVEFEVDAEGILHERQLGHADH